MKTGAVIPLLETDVPDSAAVERSFASWYKE